MKQLNLLELRVAISSGRFHIGIGYVTSPAREAMATGWGEPFKALAQKPWTIHAGKKTPNRNK